MRHFIAFQKRKGLAVSASSNFNNSDLVHQINHELMNFGYVMTQDLFNALSGQSEEYLQDLYKDLIGGIKGITGKGGYEPIYRNFPQSVLDLSYREFLVNAILHYWTLGTWRPEDIGHLNRELALEKIEFKQLRLLTEREFNSIFTDLIYANNSISAFDKKVIDFFIQNNAKFDYSDIVFNEIKAYVGKRLMDTVSVTTLPTRSATTVLRIWVAYSGGDEGLKTLSRLKNPSARQRKVLLSTLNECYDLEDSFKGKREMWLRMLYFLHPGTKENKTKYPIVAKYADSLRNSPKTLETFNAKVERCITGNKRTELYDLLTKRPGVFSRRLDHLVRLYGIEPVNTWLERTSPDILQLVTVYNHFSGRDKVQEGRAALLAGQDQSKMVQYESLAPLDAKLVQGIKSALLEKMNSYKSSELKGSKVYIDRSLYFTPVHMNNRAASFSLSNNSTGKCVKLEEGKTVRVYVYWHGREDIDLSGMLINKKGDVTKVGWNGRHYSGNGVVYSGDNTGYSTKNAEYLDINIGKVGSGVEWIVVDAVIYRGRSTFAEWNHQPVRAGYMLRGKPEANDHWVPSTLENSIVIGSKSRSAYLLAIHVPSSTLVYLDVAQDQSNITTETDALKMKVFLERIASIDTGEEIDWSKINQGHIVAALAESVTSEKEEADIVFDENTTFEQILRYV